MEFLIRLVTPEQLKEGWIELRGVTWIRHSYKVLDRDRHGNYVVMEPKVKPDPSLGDHA